MSFQSAIVIPTAFQSDYFPLLISHVTKIDFFLITVFNQDKLSPFFVDYNNAKTEIEPENLRNYMFGFLLWEHLQPMSSLLGRRCRFFRGCILGVYFSPTN